jgi:hypothetical protein
MQTVHQPSEHARKLSEIRACLPLSVEACAQAVCGGGLPYVSGRYSLLRTTHMQSDSHAVTSSKLVSVYTSLLHMAIRRQSTLHAARLGGAHQAVQQRGSKMAGAGPPASASAAERLGEASCCTAPAGYPGRFGRPRGFPTCSRTESADQPGSRIDRCLQIVYHNCF